MFLENKYKKWYFQIVENSSKKIYDLSKMRVEKHHIIPRCMGGNNDKTNICVLTIREHILVHRLLPKMTSDYNTQRKLLFAVARMIAGRQGLYLNLSWEKQNYIQERLSELQRQRMLGTKHTEESKRKISEGQKNRPPASDETKRKISEKNTGRLLGIKIPEERKEKIRQSQLGKKKTLEHVEKINKNPEKIRKTAEKHRGMKRSDEARQKMREAKVGFVPWNKGKTGIYSEETLHKMKKAKENLILWNKVSTQ